jgi:prefoldin subunit 5
MANSSRITDLENNAGIYITQSSLQSSMSELEQSIKNMNDTILGIENKLQKINLPEGTRFYLEESEVSDFRNHFRQLRSMMSELDKSRQAFIRLASRYNLTNSTL